MGGLDLSTIKVLWAKHSQSLKLLSIRSLSAGLPAIAISGIIFLLLESLAVNNFSGVNLSETQFWTFDTISASCAPLRELTLGDEELVRKAYVNGTVLEHYEEKGVQESNTNSFLDGLTGSWPQRGTQQLNLHTTASRC